MKALTAAAFVYLALVALSPGALPDWRRITSRIGAACAAGLLIKNKRTP